MSVHASSIGWKYAIPGSVPKRQQSALKLVLLKLCDNANDTGYCWPSVTRIAKETCLSPRNVTKQITCLEQMQLVKRVSRFDGTRQVSNGYWLNLPALRDGAIELPDEPENAANANPFNKPNQPVDNSATPLSSNQGGGVLKSGGGCPQITQNHQRTIKEIHSQGKAQILNRTKIDHRF